MRALIRVDINVLDKFPANADRGAYDFAIVKLFHKLGYTPKTEIPIASHAAESDHHGVGSSPERFDWEKNQKTLEDNETVKGIFEGVPKKNVGPQEMSHLIMLGYIGEGQTHFVVCAVNERELHVRLRNELFRNLRKSCADLTKKIRQSAKLEKRILRRGKNYLSARPTIEVLEHEQPIPTIIGTLIHAPLAALFAASRKEMITAAMLFVIFIVLFVYAPTLGKNLHVLLPGYTEEYLQGFLERVYSAALVTFLVATADLSMKYWDLRRVKPIRWNSGITAELGHKEDSTQ